jgi:hypothetical protein
MREEMTVLVCVLQFNGLLVCIKIMQAEGLIISYFIVAAVIRIKLKMH